MIDRWFDGGRNLPLFEMVLVAENRAPRAERFRPVHGAVRSAQQRCNVRGGGYHASPVTSRPLHRLTVYRCHAGERRMNGVSNREHGVFVLYIASEHHEFIAAQSGDSIDSAHA